MASYHAEGVCLCDFRQTWKVEVIDGEIHVEFLSEMVHTSVVNVVRFSTNGAFFFLMPAEFSSCVILF